MKRGFLAVLSILIVFCFALPMKAYAWGYEISDAIFTLVYSPDSNSGDPTTAVSVAPSGTVTIGTFSLEGDLQPEGFYGVGISLAPFSAATGFQLAFAPQLYTYDSSAYDLFYVYITKGDYLWNGGAMIGGATWGGTTEGGLEALTGLWGIFSTVLVSPASDYYYNIALNTTADSDFPSWGQAGDVAINPIPEPTTVLLFGSGLLGLAGIGFRKKRS